MIVALAIVNDFVVATGESNSCTGSMLCCGLAQSDCDGFARSVRSSLVVDTSLAAPSVPLECAPDIEGYSCRAPYNVPCLGRTWLLPSTSCKIFSVGPRTDQLNYSECGIKTYDNGCQFMADYACLPLLKVSRS